MNISNVINHIGLALLLLWGWIPAEAETPDSLPELRPVTSVYRFEAGRAGVVSTYLSPLRYTGTSMALSGLWTKALPQNPRSLVMAFSGGATYQNMLNEAHTSRMYGLQATFAWGLQYRWHLPNGVQVSAGGDAEIYGGLLYLSRNSNNPVSALAAFDLAAAGAASYVWKIGRIPVLVSDRLRIPSVGAFFCQEYGETYYEIYLGNHSGLAHFGWWGNRFCIDNLLSIQLDLGRTALEVGYRYSLMTQWANSLSTRISTHAFVIGVIPQGLGLKKKRKENFSTY